MKAYRPLNIAPYTPSAEEVEAEWTGKEVPQPKKKIAARRLHSASQGATTRPVFGKRGVENG